MILPEKPFVLSLSKCPAELVEASFASAQQEASTSPKVKFILSARHGRAVEGLSPNGVGGLCQ